MGGATALPNARVATPAVPLRRPGGHAGAGYHLRMITGLHAIVFSPDADKVRAFFADVLGLSSVDAGGGWLIFAMPPAELAVHPADSGRHELYLMCDDIHETLAGLRAKGVEVAQEVADQGWGLLAAIRLPDGTELPIYQPRHPSPLAT
jgi:predicted enzyme related to lactoylglutathione lyase